MYPVLPKPPGAVRVPPLLGALSRLTLLGVLGVLGLSGCNGFIGDPAEGSGSTGWAAPDGAAANRPGPEAPPPPDDLSNCRVPNQEIFAGLYESCAGCHGASAQYPFFADLESFERLVAYASLDPLPGQGVYVVPGDPDGSELLGMLEGTSTRSQMPPGESSYAALLEAGVPTAPATLTQIRSWISDLEICELPAPEPQTVARRLSAEAIRSELMRQLGLDHGDIAGSGRPLGSPDDAPQLMPMNQRAAAHAAWQDLGGAHILDGRRSSLEVSEAMVQTLVPMTQAWCAISVRDHDALFRHASRDADPATDATAILENIEFLFLHMLGEQASTADVGAMFDLVYAPTAAEEGPRVAWTAVCATLVRDPLWLTY